MNAIRNTQSPANPQPLAPATGARESNLVRWKTLSEGARRLLRLARVRPIKQECFANAARVVCRINLPGVRYAEGWVHIRGEERMFAHAWIVEDGVPVDVTLPELPQVFTCRKFNARAIATALLRRGGGWGAPITPELVQARYLYPPCGWWPRTVLERQQAAA